MILKKVRLNPIKKPTLLFAFIFLTHCFQNAQAATTTAADALTVQKQAINGARQEVSIDSTPAIEKPVFQKQMALGLSLGIANGIGLDVAYRLMPHLSIKGNFNYARYTLNNFQYTLQPKASDPVGTTPQTFSFNVAAQFSTLSLGAEYSLGKKGRFRLLGGLAYAPSNTLTVSGELASVVRFNDVELNSDDLGKGSLIMGFKQKIAPYIGVGIGRLHPRKKLNVSIDLGAYYKGDYKFDISVIEGGLLKKENEQNATVLDKNFNAKFNNKLWPNANLRIGYRLF